jgi:hypothetical protein
MTMTFVLVAAMLATTGCMARLREPSAIESPYVDGRLWAVAPFLNESGTSIVNTAAVADAFVSEAQDVRQIDVLAVNRVIRAMRGLGMSAVTSHGDATTLMNVLDLDGLIVGTVTAYDPYRPKRLGMAVQLYVRDGRRGSAGVDPRALERTSRGATAIGEIGPPHPVGQAAGVFDASNHRVLRWLETYADARHEPDSAYGQDIYLVDMDLYTRFVCNRLLQDLLDGERVRLAPVITAAQ